MNKFIKVKVILMAVACCGILGLTLDLAGGNTAWAFDVWGGFADGSPYTGFGNGKNCNNEVSAWVSSRGYTKADYTVKTDLTGNTGYPTNGKLYHYTDPTKPVDVGTCKIYAIRLADEDSNPNNNNDDKDQKIYPYLLNGQETGFGVNADCNNIVRYTPIPKVENSWRIETGSYSQVTTGANPANADWSNNGGNKDFAIGTHKNFYFTHSAGVERVGGDVGNTFSDQWKNVKSNITVTFDRFEFKYDSNGDGAVNASDTSNDLSPGQISSFFKSTNCTPLTNAATKSNYWTSPGWALDGNPMPNLNTATGTESGNGRHIGLRPEGGEGSYLCNITINDENALKAFGKAIKVTSKITITLNPENGGANDSLDAGVVKSNVDTPEVGGPVSSYATVTIKPRVDTWSVSVMSHIQAQHSSGPADTIQGCSYGAWCAGKVGIGSDAVLEEASSTNPIDGPPIIVSTPKPPDSNPDEACLKADGTDGDTTKCVEFSVNFKHTVTVGGTDTGTDKTKKQLWLYAVANEAYPDNRLTFETNVCLGSGRSVNGGSDYRTRTAVRWHSVVLEANKTYDILSSGTPTATTVDGAKVLCATSIKNEKTKKGAWRSVLYLCFATGTNYDYGYFDSETGFDSATVNRAKNTCQEKIEAHLANDSGWTEDGGTDGTLLTSHAVAAYTPEPGGVPPNCDNDPATLDVPDCSEIAVSKTQTCAVNNQLGYKCDPEGTTPEAPGQPDEFQALDPTDKKTAITQLARPGDSIKFVHNFDKAAQKLNADTTWETLPGFNPTKCHTNGTYSSKTATMRTTDETCVTDGGWLTPFETSITRSHSVDEAKSGESAYQAIDADANKNKTYTIRDDCFYTGRESMFSTSGTVNLSRMSYHNIKTPTGNLLNRLQAGGIEAGNQCVGMDPEGKLHEESVPHKVENGDVGSKEIYQRATLFDRVAQKLKNCQKGACKADYSPAGPKTTGTTQNNTGEDSEHKYSVKWRIARTCSSEGGCCSDCSGCCCTGRTVYGSPHDTSCCGGCNDGDYDGFGTYTEWEHTWVKLVDVGPTSSNAQFNIPYNYQIIPRIDTTKFPDGRMLHGGSELDYETWFNIVPVTNAEFGENYATITRPGTHWEITEFYIDENVTSDPNTKDERNNKEPCSSYIHAEPKDGVSIQNVSRNCYTKASGTGSLNAINGANHTGSNDARNSDTGWSDLTAKIADAPAGTKFCIGVSVYDELSYYNNDDSTTYGDAVKGNWIHLKPECVSISKIVTMQVWGGDLYSENQVIGKYATKVPAPYLSYWKSFGSWSEYHAIGSVLSGGDATLKVYGSGAAFGQGLEAGGITNQGIIEGCDFIKLSIKNVATPAEIAANTNNNCATPSNTAIGNSTAFKGLAQRVALRYTNRVQNNQWITGDTAKVDSITGEGYADGD
ncbi:MAG: hypothetical protein LBQ02_04625, partial [Candidatus Nomurabacteria bacterium]|nr:hypothetical protein [Candidatus Nomurabacteria bacterium]